MHVVSPYITCRRQTWFYLCAFLSVIAIFCDLPACALSPNPKPPVIDLRTYIAIHVAAIDGGADYRMARVLRNELQRLYGINLPIRTEAPEPHHRVILVGRAIVAELGLLPAARFEPLKWDGYLIEAMPNRIVIAGDAPQGTVYGTYAFLRKVGLTFYPWHFGKGLRRYDPVVEGRLPAFAITDKPFFELRDVLGHRGKGRFGSTIRAHTLGELKWAQEQPELKSGGYLGWDHTAGYLAPIKTYLASHPEFYPMQKGRTIPRSTPTMRVGICACHNALEAITINNALAWMNRQPSRRFFGITDGDQAGWRCPSCAATDPSPDYYTDRNLRWVNAVARAVRSRHPDKRVFTLAYLGTVKPPIEAGLEPNAMVLYAPWYWTSRATSAVGFDHPINIIAMEEFMAWTRLFPGQIGVYDYPGDWVYGTAERIQFYAKHGIRWVYMNGPRGDLLHWVASQLLWDPTRDVDDLVTAFVKAFYGPAADVMQAYYTLRRDTLRKRALTSFSSLAFLQDDEFINQGRRLLRLAIAQAEGTAAPTQARIYEGVIDQLDTVIRAEMAMQTDAETLRSDFEFFLQSHATLWSLCDQLNCSDRQWVMRTRSFSKKLKRLGLPPIEFALTSKADRQSALDRALSMFTRMIQNRVSASAQSTPNPSARRAFTFASPDETLAWQAWMSDKPLSRFVKSHSIDGLNGETLNGAGATLTLSQLPMADRGRLRVHAGQFRLRRRFEPALDGQGQRYLSLHLRVSHAVPITIYLNEKRALRSDVRLHAGEQIVRIDLHNFARRGHQTLDMSKIDTLTLDIWPQNLFYPYPETQDTDLLLLGLYLDHRPPAPQVLPYRGRVIWMSHFRPNVPHAQTGVESTDTGLHYLPGSRQERFRSSTPHRLLSPIAAIVTAPMNQVLQTETVSHLQRHLEVAYGVKLPVRGPRRGPGPMSNAIYLGPVAALAQNRSHWKALDEVAQGEFVIRARKGAIAVSGHTWKDTRKGVNTYLHRHGIGAQFQPPPPVSPIARSPFLHELYLTATLP